MRFTIVDDDARERGELRSAIEDYCRDNGTEPGCEFFERRSAEELFADFTPGLYDAVFLDIYMGGVSGIEAARRLYLLDPECCVVLFTSSDAHLLEGYGVHAVGYVLKPLRDNLLALHTALNFIMSRMTRNRAAMDVETEFGRQKLSFRNIVQLHASGRCAVACLANAAVKLCGTYSDYAPTLLTDPRFLECYHKVIINMDYIDGRSESGDFITITGGRVPISRRRRNEVLKKYMEYFLARGGM